VSGVKKMYNINQQNAPLLKQYFNFYEVFCVLNPRVYLQENGCTYRYGIAYLHAEIAITF
jgi:hypothetical protein